MAGVFEEELKNLARHIWETGCCLSPLQKGPKEISFICRKTGNVMRVLI